MSVDLKHLLGEAGLEQLAGDIFQLIEDNYVRRSQYDAAIKELNDKINEIDIIYRYNFQYDGSSGELTMVMPDNEEGTLQVNNDGYLILTEPDEQVSGLENMSFNSATGDLLLTVDTSSDS